MEMLKGLSNGLISAINDAPVSIPMGVAGYLIARYVFLIDNDLADLGFLGGAAFGDYLLRHYRNAYPRYRGSSAFTIVRDIASNARKYKSE